MDLPTIAEVATAAVAVLTLLAAATAGFFAYSKSKGNEAAISILTTANTGLRGVNADLVARQDASERECQEQLHAQEVKFTGQISELQGKLSLLTNGLANEIVVAVVTAMDKHAAKE